MARTVPCNVCEGRGRYWWDDGDYGSEWRTCKKCNGTGKIELPELPRPAMFEDEEDESDNDMWGV